MKLPEPEEVVDAVVKAVENGSNPFDLVVVAESIKVIAFDEQLTNRSSPEFQSLESVVAMCDAVMVASFGLLFDETIVIGFGWSNALYCCTCNYSCCVATTTAAVATTTAAPALQLLRLQLQLLRLQLQLLRLQLQLLCLQLQLLRLQLHLLRLQLQLLAPAATTAGACSYNCCNCNYCTCSYNCCNCGYNCLPCSYNCCTCGYNCCACSYNCSTCHCCTCSYNCCTCHCCTCSYNCCTCGYNCCACSYNCKHLPLLHLWSNALYCCTCNYNCCGCNYNCCGCNYNCCGCNYNCCGCNYNCCACNYNCSTCHYCTCSYNCCACSYNCSTCHYCACSYNCSTCSYNCCACSYNCSTCHYCACSYNCSTCHYCCTCSYNCCTCNYNCSSYIWTQLNFVYIKIMSRDGMGSDDMGNVTATVELKFDEEAPLDELPEPEEVVDAVVKAVENGSNAFDLVVVAESIKVVEVTIDEPTTTSAPEAPAPAVVLNVTFVEAFDEQLTNRSSPEFQSLEGRVVALCDAVMVASFGLLFDETIVIGFGSDDMGNVTATVELKFDEEAPLDELPEPEEVVDAVVKAVENGSNAFDLVVVAESIKVVEVTIDEPTTTSAPEAPAPAVVLNVTFVEAFDEQLTNRSSPEFQSLEGRVVALCDAVMVASFGLLFDETIVIGFGSDDMGNVTATVELKFDEEAPLDELPEPEEVVDAVVKAVENGSNAFDLVVVAESIKVVEVTIDEPTTTSAPEAPAPAVVLNVTFVEAFDEQLTNRSSPEFQSLERQVVALCDAVMVASFGLLFDETIVIGFGSDDMGNVTATVELKFDEEAPLDELPEPEEVVDAVVKAVENGSNAFDLVVVAESIKVVEVTIDEPTTTSAPEAPAPAVVLNVTFVEAFDEQLTNRSSPEFQSLEGRVVALCDAVMVASFGPLFDETIVIGFGSDDMGNVTATVELKFDEEAPLDELPEPEEVVDAVVKAVENGSNAFDLVVVAESIKVVEVTIDEPTTTSAPEAPAPAVVLNVTFVEAFDEQLTNRSSPEFQSLEGRVVALRALALLFDETIVIGFGSDDMGNVTATVELKFDEEAPLDELPEPEEVVDAVVKAVENGSNAFDLVVVAESIKVVEVTIDEPTTTSAPEAPAPAVVLNVTFVEAFDEQLTNRSSPEFQSLEGRVVALCDAVMVASFGPLFDETIVIGFGSDDMGNVTATVELKFDEEAPLDELPEPEEVVDAVVKAVENGSNAFDLVVVAESIKVVEVTIDEPTTTSAPEAPAPAVVLNVTFVEAFDEQLTNRSSPEFQSLEGRVVALCDTVMVASFGPLFDETIVIGFGSDDMGNVTATVELKFDEEAPLDELPEPEEVVDAVVKAVENGSNAFDLVVVAESIKVVEVTIEEPTTTSAPEAPAPAVVLNVTFVEAFDEQLTNRSSPEFQSLEGRVVALCDAVMVASFGPLFDETIVIGFGSDDMGNVTATVELKFDEEAPLDELPEPEEVVDAVVKAVENGSNAFDLVVVAESIKVVEVTIDEPTTTSAPEAPAPAVVLNVTFVEAFDEQLTNRSSPEFQSLEGRVVALCDAVMVASFGLLFDETIVIGFGSDDMGNVTATVELKFDEEAPLDELPEPEEVVDAVVKAVENGSNAFDLVVVAESIKVVEVTIDEPTTTSAPEAPAPAVVLNVTFVEAFDEQLTNRSSPEFQSLEGRVVALCDAVMVASFGPLFDETIVIGFGSDDMGNVTATVELKFDEEAPLDELPEPEEVVDAVVKAVENGSNAFDLVVVAESIKVIGSTLSSGATTTSVSPTTHGSTIGGSSSPGPQSTEKSFTLSSTTGDGLKTTKESVTPTASTIGSGLTTTGGSTATGATGGSSTAGSSTDGSTATTASPATGGSSTAGLTTDGSTATTASPSTGGSNTAGPSTGGSTTSAVTISTVGPGGAATTPSPPAVVLGATLAEPFVEELNNPSSAQYMLLETRVVTLCDVIYRRQFGFLFLRTIVVRFRRAARRTRMDNTAVDVKLEFNNSATQEQIPTGEVAAQTLKEALSSPNNTFNVTIDPDTIVVIQTAITTTAAANSTAPMTTSATAAPATTEQLTTRKLTFTSSGETFTNDLLSSSSQAFINRAAMIKSNLEPPFKMAFSTFRSLTATSFSNGSVINNMGLAFASTSVPNGTQIANVLVAAASNITAFNINTTSIIVDGTQVSGGASHKISLITASFLVLLSWLLSNQQ
ncbi:uncharacterized protein LOC117807800 [Notolabrus celidotus]|uniref:uncharacterized protein LOC117807800 n=1 Tax=Notolabrus celidotus TaxID=1203425 RepID=UPI00148FFBFF|nr:uncharacterized protein LOC117807800 [Notolabrus celidotus]